MGLTFQEAEEALSRFKNRGWRLGIDRMQEFCDRLGLTDFLNGQQRPKFIHIAGTNGKGSVTRFCQAILTENGIKTGSSFSPFVSTVRERSQIDGELISEGEFAQFTEKLLSVGKTMEDTEFGGPTEFEMKTALGFLHWQAHSVEAACVEVGLGGRLDATNVLTPACSVIVSIGLDHQEHLGETESEIAQEKAGIIKKNCPTVVGKLSDEAYHSIWKAAFSLDSELLVLGRDFRIESAGRDRFHVYTESGDYQDLVCAIPGRIQRSNAALAIAALEAAGYELHPDKVRSALANAALPGRFEVIDRDGTTVVFDGAHNEPAAAHLVEELAQRDFRSPVWVCGFMENHDPVPFLERLAQIGGRLILTRAFFERAHEPQSIDTGQIRGFDQIEVIEDQEQALQAAVELSDLVVVTGSFYLVGALRNQVL